MKHLHMLVAILLILLFAYQSYVVLGNNSTRHNIDKSIDDKSIDTPVDNAKKPLSSTKVLKILTHISYALIIATGAWMLMQLMSVGAQVQWVFAKIILLIAAISACIKAFRATAAPSQRKAGIIVATIAYTGIIILAFTQPANIL